MAQETAMPADVEDLEPPDSPLALAISRGKSHATIAAALTAAVGTDRRLEQR